MGFFSFIKDAGEKLFGAKEAQAATAEVAAKPDDGAAQAKLAAANSAAGDAIQGYIEKQGLKVTGLTVTFDALTGTTNVFGVAADQDTKEKVVLCCGNVEGVEKVNDNMSVDKSGPECGHYTVVKGDTLSKIAKNAYGDPNKYPVIFEANKPMLTHPDKIYPGQCLRIPAL